MAIHNMIISITIVVIVLSSLTLISTSQDDGLFPRTTTVLMVNKLGLGIEMNTHCKSKQDDLGTHAVAPNASYHFSFKPRFFGGTLYFCNIWWNNGGGDNISRSLDIYDQSRDGCTDCCWNILYDQGMCSCDDAEHCFNWNN